MTTSKSPKQSEDLISNVLHIIHDKILELLPIWDAARMSVLSKQWRCNWLSLNRLDFNINFFYDDAKQDWQECCNIISSIFLYHNGPIHEFKFFVPLEAYEKSKYLGQLLSFLSKNEVRRLKMFSEGYELPISSHIFRCSELVHLELELFTLHSPPSGFNGFPNLRHLSLNEIEFSKEDIFPVLIAKCCKLVTLTLSYCRGIRHIVIDVPTLETLKIDGNSKYESIAFGDLYNLKTISLCLWNTKPPTVETIDAFFKLAHLRQLQCIHFGGELFKKGLAATIINRILPDTFNHLIKLILTSVDLSSIDVVRNIFGMVDCCPYMKELVVSVHSIKRNVNPHKLDYTKFHKSPRLLEVKIYGIKGSGVEIQLIEYLLTIAVELDRLFYKSYDFDTESQLKLSKVLSEIPRASPKARLVCLTRL